MRLCLAFLLCMTGAMDSGCGGAPGRSGPAPAQADLILWGGPVLTADARGTVAEALAVRAGRVLRVGDRPSVEPLRGPHTRVVELAGRAVVPGFADCHAHYGQEAFPAHRLFEWGLSREQMVAKLREELGQEPDLPLVLGGWIPIQVQGTRADLDAVSATRPILVQAADSHAVWLNTPAMEWIDAGSLTPGQGDVVVRDATGRLEGVFFGFGMMERINQRAVDRAPAAAVEALVRAELGRLPAQGITTLHNMSFSGRSIEVFAGMAARGELPVRVREMAYGHEPALLEASRTMAAPRPELFRFSGVKYFLSGAPFSGNGAFAGNVRSAGLRMTDEELRRLVAEHTRRGEPVAFHATGELAVHQALEAVEAAGPAAVSLRHRLEHADVMEPADEGRLRRLGVVLSMQPCHFPAIVPVPVDARTFPEIGRFGFARHVRGSIPVCLGADGPVPPLASMSLAMQGPSSGEGLTFEEALAAHTRVGAWAAHDEADLGEIAEGKWADLVVLGRDPRGASPDEVAALPIDETLLAGVSTFRAGRPTEGPGRAPGEVVHTP